MAFEVYKHFRTPKKKTWINKLGWKEYLLITEANLLNQGSTIFIFWIHSRIVTYFSYPGGRQRKMLHLQQNLYNITKRRRLRRIHYPTCSALPWDPQMRQANQLLSLLPIYTHSPFSLPLSFLSLPLPLPLPLSFLPFPLLSSLSYTH